MNRDTWRVIILVTIIIGSCVIWPGFIIVWGIVGLLAWLLKRDYRKCVRCGGRLKRYYGKDYASRGSMAMAVDRCEQCELVKVVEMNEVK